MNKRNNVIVSNQKNDLIGEPPKLLKFSGAFSYSQSDARYLLTSSQSSQTISGSSGAIMTWASNGKVGINESSPDELLHVTGGNEPLIKVEHTNVGGVSKYLRFGPNAGNQSVIFEATTGFPFKFYNGQYALTIDGSGNVSCVGKLAVNGASYVAAEGSTTSMASAGAWTDIVFTTEVVDNLGEFDGTIFTATDAGIYTISYSLGTSDVAWAVGDSFAGLVSKNNSVAGSGGSCWQGWSWEPEGSNTAYIAFAASVILKLAANDNIRIKSYIRRSGGNTSLDGYRADNYFQIARIQ